MVYPESGKTANSIRMPFGMVSGVGRGMSVLDGVVIVEGEGQFWGVTNGDFATLLFPNYSGRDSLPNVLICRTPTRKT